MEEQFEKAQFFDSVEELAQAQQQEMPAATQEAPLQEQVAQEPTQEAVQEQTTYNDYQSQGQPEQNIEYSDEEVESEVLSYLSERLNRNISSFDDLSEAEQEAREIDERVWAIAEFVEKTGRGPEEWFNYQSLNTSEMDDVTAIRVDMAARYPNLSVDEIDTLLSDKYKTNTELYDEDQVRLANLQLKIDAQEARKGIEEIRETYAAPEIQEQTSEDFIDEEWLSEMQQETIDMEGLEFDLGNGNSFTYSINDQYRNTLIDKNANIDDFFDDYIDQNGNWDHDMFNSHRTLIDNIDAIVSSAYNQGVGDGQRGLVNKAANISTETPRQSGQNRPNPLAEQVTNILNQNRNKMTFGNF